jgi:puromycin-sensitive aminopeptidase
MADKKPFCRLPTSVVPKKYELTYSKIDLVNFVFEGVVRIICDVNTPTSEITMHAVELWIKSTTVEQEGKDKVDAKTVSTNFGEQTATVVMESEMVVGTATITIEFSGILNDQLAGFYRSTYTLDGKPRVMATTQFESTDARRAFPCWDEPAIKASFEVTLTTPADRVAVSNTPVIATKVFDGADGTKMKEWKYAETPVMSTYLLAFVVGDFDFLSDYTKEGVQVTVYTPVGKSAQGKFALDVACKCLSFFQDYFGIEYPLPKSDLLAIPDFAAGAMENWGCVTYREAALLIDEAQSSAAMRQRVAMVVCHELAHQWFGNLVTMEWWTHLWLNEGFASYMQYVAVANIFPEWNIWTEFNTSNIHRAMDLDALSTSHPIEVHSQHAHNMLTTACTHTSNSTHDALPALLTSLPPPFPPPPRNRPILAPRCQWSTPMRSTRCSTQSHTRRARHSSA